MAKKVRTYKRRTDASRNGRYYSQSSVAPRVYEDDLSARRRKAVKKPVKKPVKRHRGTRYVYNFGVNSHSIATYLVIGLIFLGCISTVFLHSFVWSVRRNVNTMESELKKLQEYNTTLEAGISASYDLFTIERRAVALGMSSPQPHQIVYISVPRETYIEQHRPVSDVSNELKLTDLKDILFRKR